MNDQQLLRYNRHIMLPQMDIAGQQKLLDAHVVIIGVGGLGSPAALYLAAAGIGKLTLVDFDTVELSNLQRQIVHTENRLGVNKAQSARQQLQHINSDIEIHCIEQQADDALLKQLAEQATLVLDCTDNFASRYAVNRACYQAGAPLVSGAAIRFDGQITVFDFRNRQNPCYACLYGDNASEEALTCSEAGILAPVVGMIGCAMATEAIKLICGMGDALVGRLLLLDALNMQWREMRYAKDPACKVCSVK